MILLEEQDFYEVINDSLIADYDYETVINFYQPIIGYQASMLYFTLISHLHLNEWKEINTHDYLFKKMHINIGEFLDARIKLEAIGLLRTYRKENKEGKAHSYIYKLYAPKTIDGFVNDPCFGSLLVAQIGQKEFNRLKAHYHKKEFKDDYLEISASYKDVYKVFNPLPKDLEILSRNVGDISSGFSQKDFFESLKEYGLKKNAFKEEDLYQIERISLLFGIKEDFMAQLVFGSFDVNESPSLDIDKLYMSAQNSIIYPTFKRREDNAPKIYEENSDFALLINKMNMTAPYEYFRYITNDQYPSPSDIAILNDLSNKYHLNIGVINCLVYYTLENLDMKFPRQYCEKVASYLVRVKAKNALEAYNFLYHPKKRDTKVKIETNKQVNDVVTKDGEQEEISVEELRKLAEDLK